ncbi:DUF1742-domain-containing protein [Phellopilus nigrolimitatus]|nr:DUF1742-domain-containing protein [Phellopilus nigrolimitatus]
MSFTNLYYKRAAATQKSCFVCSRPTATVLATKDSVDFFYACDGHLKDPGFASAVGEGADGAGGVRKPVLSEDEIQRVKEEYEEKQRRRKEKEKEKEKAKEAEKEKEKEAEKEGTAASKSGAKDEQQAKTPSASLPSRSQSPSAPAPASTHQRFALHREIFAMRRDVHRKRRQAAQAKEVAPRLPSAPRGAMSPI